MRVHGHGQCERCGTNIEPCCAGANALDEASAASGDPCGLDAGLFARLFLQLGGATATVTTEALLFALVQRLGRNFARHHENDPDRADLPSVLALILRTANSSRRLLIV